NFTYPPNTPGTLYQLEASLDNFATSLLTGVPVAQPLNATGTTGTVTVTVPGNGSSYSLRLRVISDASNSPSNWDALTTLGSATTDINPGTITGRTATSLTANWNFTPDASVSELLASATTATGSQVGTSQVLNPAVPNPTITVSQLPLSNTSYTLAIQHIDSNGTGSPVTYNGSSVLGLTLAVT